MGDGEKMPVLNYLMADFDSILEAIKTWIDRIFHDIRVRDPNGAAAFFHGILESLALPFVPLKNNTSLVYKSGNPHHKNQRKGNERNLGRITLP